MTTSPRELLTDVFKAAVDAARPRHCVPPLLPSPPRDGRLIVLAIGKAAGAMAEAAEAHYLDQSGIGRDRLEGISLTRYGYARPLRRLESLEAAHPVPDQAGIDATRRVLDLARSASAGDLILVLLSGGGSSLLIAPPSDVSLGEKQALTRALLKAGATIGEINIVRKHVSLVKGGRLALAASPAQVMTLAISDVPGDDPALIASGPTVADPSTTMDAKAILERYHITPPASIAAWLDRPESESPKPGDPDLKEGSYVFAAKPSDALGAAADHVASAGYRPVLLGDALEGEARQIAEQHAALALAHAGTGERVALISGGELTVTVRGSGRGGPNQEYALALALGFDGAAGIHALAADTDGTDGGSGSPDDPAGAIITPDTLNQARRSGVSAEAALQDNDATGFFEKTAGLLVTGPTHTNVNDLRVILVDPSGA